MFHNRSHVRHRRIVFEQLTNDGHLFGVNGYRSAFYEIDPHTGRTRYIGPTGYDGTWTLAYDSLTDTIYGLAITESLPTKHSLATYDRYTGHATPFGTGIAGIGAASGVSWDAVNRRLVVFDNSDNEFFAFDSAGNGTLLSTNLSGFPDTSWGMAAVGQYVALPLLHPEDDRRLAFFDPDTGQQLPGEIDLMPSVAFESLEYAPVSFDSAGVQGRVWLDANGNGV